MPNGVEDPEYGYTGFRRRPTDSFINSAEILLPPQHDACADRVAGGARGDPGEAAGQLAAARVEKDNKDADRTRLLALFNATEDGAAFLILKVENKALVDEIARLKAFAEEAVDIAEQPACVIRFALAAPKPGDPLNPN